MFLGYQQGKIKFYTEEKLDLTLYNLDKVEVTENEYVLDEDEYVLKNAEWEEKQREKQKERINNLTCTKRVFALILQDYGVSYSQLKNLLAGNEKAQLEWDLCERLERSNPLIDAVASNAGITPAQIDEIFIKANL